MAKSRAAQACLVSGHGLRDQDVFECGAFATDLEIAVGILSLELVMHLHQQLLHYAVLVHDFLGQHENAASDQAIVDPADHGISFRDRQELQGVIHDDHRCLLYRGLSHVPLEDRDVDLGIVAGNYLAAAPDHRRCVVHGDDLAAGNGDVAAHRQRRGAE